MIHHEPLIEGGLYRFDKAINGWSFAQVQKLDPPIVKDEIVFNWERIDLDVTDAVCKYDFSKPLILLNSIPEPVELMVGVAFCFIFLHRTETFLCVKGHFKISKFVEE